MISKSFLRRTISIQNDFEIVFNSNRSSEKWFRNRFTGERFRNHFYKQILKNGANDFWITDFEKCFWKNIPDQNRRSVWKSGAINGANGINGEDPLNNQEAEERGIPHWSQGEDQNWRYKSLKVWSKAFFIARAFECKIAKSISGHPTQCFREEPANSERKDGPRQFPRRRDWRAATARSSFPERTTQ